MNTDWAIDQLEKFISLLEYKSKPGLYQATYRGSNDEIAAQKGIVEQIWGRTIGPDPSSDHSDEERRANSRDPWRSEKDWAIRCLEWLTREAELKENLGDNAPSLEASLLHPWIWDGARSLWQSAHYVEAVAAAARKVNAETQNKLGRRDISETTLFQQAFSDDAPTSEKPRLRLPNDDGGQTARSVRRGIRAYAEGWFSAIRNPTAHDTLELDQHLALEQLAALSLLARWIDLAERVAS